MITDVKRLPLRPSLEEYRKQAKDLVEAWKVGDAEAPRRVKTYHPRYDQNAARPALALTDAQLVIAREYGFESWPKFESHIEALNRENSSVFKFELAADAIAAGDVPRLERLLRETPSLVGARSTRAHRGTLLHYAGANGIEDYRQKTPKNAVAVLQVLLDAGAEVDAEADMYHNDTPLGLVATSFHPAQAGVQTAMMETLLAAGATIDAGGLAINACLVNGRGAAAEFLAKRGARLDLEGAAGVGRLDVVKTFTGATKAELELAFLRACEYGRNDVVDFLLEKGVDLRAQAGTGQTGLHWAVIGGQLKTIRLLLKRAAPLEELNEYGGTVLGQALWSAVNGNGEADYVLIIETLIGAGAVIEDGSLAWLAKQDRGSSEVKSRIAEVLRRRSTSSVAQARPKDPFA